MTAYRIFSAYLPPPALFISGGKYEEAWRARAGGLTVPFRDLPTIEEIAKDCGAPPITGRETAIWEIIFDRWIGLDLGANDPKPPTEVANEVARLEATGFFEIEYLETADEMDLWAAFGVYQGERWLIALWSPTKYSVPSLEEIWILAENKARVMLEDDSRESRAERVHRRIVLVLLFLGLVMAGTGLLLGLTLSMNEDRFRTVLVMVIGGAFAVFGAIAGLRRRKKAGDRIKYASQLLNGI